jgi:hypothetical protein
MGSQLRPSRPGCDGCFESAAAVRSSASRDCFGASSRGRSWLTPPRVMRCVRPWSRWYPRQPGCTSSARSCPRPAAVGAGPVHLPAPASATGPEATAEAHVPRNVGLSISRARYALRPERGCPGAGVTGPIRSSAQRCQQSLLHRTSGRAPRMLTRFQRCSVVAQRREARLVAAAFRRHIEHVPERPDGIDVAGLEPLFSRRVHELRGPRMAELVTVVDEHV